MKFIVALGATVAATGLVAWKIPASSQVILNNAHGITYLMVVGIAALLLSCRVVYSR